MPHGRPPLSPRPLTHDFIVIKQLTPTEGYNNGGIFKVKDRRTGKKCIEKRFNPEDVVHGEAYNEISKTAMLKHENIVEYVHAFLESHAPYRASLYVGLCNYGSLDDVLNKFYEAGIGVAESLIWKALKQLTRALGYIHHGIRDVIHEGASGAREPGWEMLLHRDIAPKNIFIRRSGERVRFLLGDFGCAMEFHNQAIWRVKTPAWGPPEAPRYVEQSDIWSLGLVISSMAVLEGPAKRYGALSNMHDMFGNIEREFSPQLADAIERALHPDYRKRPTAVTFGPYLRESQRIAYYTDHDFPDQWDEDGDDPLSLWY